MNPSGYSKHVFQRLPGIWLICTLLISSIGPYFTPQLFVAIYLFLQVIFVLNGLRTAWAMIAIYFASVKHSKTDWYQKYLADAPQSPEPAPTPSPTPPLLVLADAQKPDSTDLVDTSASVSSPCTALPEKDLDSDASSSDGSAVTLVDSKRNSRFYQVRHVIIIPNYKEDIGTLTETLDVLASHTIAKAQYKICLAMEASESGSELKANDLIAAFRNKFLFIDFTQHPSGLVGEIRGKSSNVSWAARQMSIKIEDRNDHVYTVMDADTCFTQDYFMAINYHFGIAPQEKRNRMMFATSVVFDRNAKDIPFIVRTADNMWAIGGISNMYQGSSTKIPTSAYSVSMNLARSVDFWDVGPEAIGEDMHMYAKCFFATGGSLEIVGVYSPASQCNIEGKHWFSTLWARYGQSRRHLWGSLDTGYVLERTFNHMYRYLTGKQIAIDIENQVSPSHFPLLTYLDMVYRILELHVFLIHIVLVMLITSVSLPNSTVGSLFFSRLSNPPTLDSYVMTCVNIAGMMRNVAMAPFVLTIIVFEFYHHWIAIGRWKHAAQSTGNVQYLGKRSQFVSTRSLLNLLDWIALPVSGVLYGVLPALQANISHFWTNSLEYKVAGKPVASIALPVGSLENESLATAPASTSPEAPVTLVMTAAPAALASSEDKS
ncbi:glycosyl transferase family group 2-domain-containing protein [Polychytrium aggregatum]|uniref:glycosyl transferase family group 2-domain-containing protein n=1 Tax=Polychytrium aggregatum TaxID=110093 RepID=UPI0022FDDAE6|nr:glycosyl transferase family group 2-domain-containing protein [Polychytrium aggregatum]KAI9202182.1 glycosyl transferase family group 2-domain-containing protein [Polychytrium aggregatum]